MPGLVPGIHVFGHAQEDVDGRVRPDHDEWRERMRALLRHPRLRPRFQLALLGWIFVFATTDWTIIAFGLGTLVIGILCFFLWSRHTKQWPFAAEGLSDAV